MKGDSMLVQIARPILATLVFVFGSLVLATMLGVLTPENAMQLGAEAVLKIAEGIALVGHYLAQFALAAASAMGI